MKKRSKYKPKGVRLDAMAYIKSGFMKVAKVPDAGLTLVSKNRAALDEIMYGRGDKDHVDILIHAFNQAEAIAHLFPAKGADWMPEIREAQDAVYNMGRRGISGKSFVFTGPELQAVKLAMQVHEQQLEETSVKEIEQAINYVAARIRSKKVRVIQSLEKEHAETTNS
jgi:hypothetical protein